MAKKHELLIPVEKIGGESNPKRRTFISLEVYYVKDGYGYGRRKPRGVYVSAGPVFIEETDVPGLIVKGFQAFSAKCQLIEEAARLNQRRVLSLYEEAVADYKAKQGPAYALVADALERNGLKLLEESPAVAG